MDKVEYKTRVQTVGLRENRRTSTLDHGKGLDPGHLAIRHFTMAAAESGGFNRVTQNTKAHPSPRVLVVEDDPITLATLAEGLRREGMFVATADCGASAIARATRGDLDFIVVDLRLPDINGVDVIRTLHDDGVEADFIVISGFATVESTVAAMKLGALAVLEKPFDNDELVSLLRISRSTGRTPSSQHDGVFTNADNPSTERAESAKLLSCVGTAWVPRSPVERWVLYVLKACKLPHDPRTLTLWAKGIGVSTSTLRETCYLNHVRPHDARDFARALRATLLQPAHGASLEGVLDISDRRTLAVFCDRTGLVASDPSVLRFLRRQSLILSDNDGLQLIRKLLDGKM